MCNEIPKAIVNADATMFVYKLDDYSYRQVSYALWAVLSQKYDGNELAELFSDGMSGRVGDLEDTITIEYIKSDQEEE